MNLDKNLILIGFMGSGKTTVGRKLSAALGRMFIDTDSLIEETEGISIQEIFASKGEAYFREAELAAAKTLSSGHGAVIATGGGMVKSPEAMAHLKENGIVIYLKTKPREVLRRTSGDDTRPLLSGPDKLLRVTELLEERAPLYEKYADITLDTVRYSPGAVLREVLMAIELYEMGAGQ